VAVLVLVAGGLTAYVRSRSDHPGGDPGGAVLRALSPVAGAVPSGSTGIDTRTNDAIWSPACPDNPYGRAGWSGVTVLTTFRSADTAPSLVRAVGTSLASHGWTPTTPVDDAAWQYTPVAEWTRSVPGARAADVVVFPYPAPGGSAGTRWMLGAEAKTPGYALPGC